MDNFFKQETLTDFTVSKQDLPAKIGPYKIEGLLARGGMSLIYLGQHPHTKEMLVIKVLSPENVTHPELVAQFLKETKIIEMANHPNIVKLFSVGEWEGGLYIAMEFIRGVSLSQFIIQQSLSLKRSVDIILQVAYALAHLHSHGIIHGDLKPENILITEDGEVKVIDFGIARLHDEPKSIPAQKPIGTPAYMSPEQKEDPGKMTFASDIYSLGIIAYELAMGKLSFGVIHLSLLPKGVRKLIEKAVAISPDERYSSIIALITDLSQYLKSGGLEKDKPGTDQMKEFQEVIQTADQNLSPLTPPHWSDLEVGISKYRAPAQVGNYFDFFKFSDNSYGIVMAQTESSTLENAVFIASLRGVVRTILNAPYSPDWISTLNSFIAHDPLGHKYAFAFLHLDHLNDSLTFSLCGLGSVIHVPQESQTPRKLTNQNPLIGKDANAEFMATTDNWQVGDSLLFHNIDPAAEPLLLETLNENRFLSPQPQAETLMKKIAAHFPQALHHHPKLLLSLHRVA